MNDLRVYKLMPEWSAETLPQGFQRKHRTKQDTWARLVVSAGALRFTLLDEDGQEMRAQDVDASTGPLLVEPGVWHKVAPLGQDLRCQLAFLCEPARYLEKKHGLTAPHSEVRALLPQLEASGGWGVLDLGSGRGRNALWLAERGFEVTAVDRSEDAIQTLRRIQEAEGLELSSHVYDINRALLAQVLEGGAVDHILSTVVFQFLDPDQVGAIIQDMQAVTRAGGLHLIVAPITSSQLPCPLPFPHLFSRGELRGRYQGWEILRDEEAPGEFHKRDERGERHKAEFATFVARKP